MTNKAVYLVIVADKKINAFMQAADVFEKGKVLGVVQLITITFEPEVALALDYNGLTTGHLVNALTSTGMIVSFVHLVYIQHNLTIDVNAGKINPYYNPEVRIISNGVKWFMFDEYLRRIGFEVTTDEWRYIKELKFKELNL